MAHYALLNENNEVIQVITGVDENIIQTDLDGTQVGGSTEAWEQFYATRPWLNATSCKRTSYNALESGFRKNFAGIGYKYDIIRDAFIPPKPSPACILNEETCRWEYPLPYPEDGKRYIWDQAYNNWREVL